MLPVVRRRGPSVYPFCLVIIAIRAASFNHRRRRPRLWHWHTCTLQSGSLLRAIFNIVLSCFILLLIVANKFLLLLLPHPRRSPAVSAQNIIISDTIIVFLHRLHTKNTANAVAVFILFICHAHEPLKMAEASNLCHRAY